MKIRVWITIMLMGNTLNATCQAGPISAYSFDSLVLLHQILPAGPVPTAFDPDGVYPYVSYCETSARPQPTGMKFIALENRFLRVLICPDLGGKVTSMVMKPSGEEVLYHPSVIRHTRILPRFYFVAGGIEVSFPISHSPSQNEQVLSNIEKKGERIYVTCGERELRFGMQWSVEYSLGINDEFLTQRVRLHNPGTRAYPWMSWSNAAVPSAPDTEFHFPDGKVLSHSSTLDTIDWESQGPRYEADIREMTGYFWKDPSINAFGIFSHSLGTGLYHVADRSGAPGMKLWSYGGDSAWAVLSSAKNEPYIEIQGGPIGDQSVKLELQPGRYHTHTEFWYPVDHPVNIDTLKVPEVIVRPESQIPMFQWAREESAGSWLQLVKAKRSGGPLPVLPPVTECCWPPSGMEDLGPAFEWALKNREAKETGLYQFYYGCWLAGCGEQEKAIELLSGSGEEMARVLLARLLRIRGDFQKAADAYRSIGDPWLSLHPQVVIERDRTLRLLGPETLPERTFWLDQVNALEDEWIIERRVQLLIDKGNPSEAKALLLSAVFQKVHQDYTRTGLWIQICEMLDEASYPIPEQLGEDRLARFGAYREYE